MARGVQHTIEPSNDGYRIRIIVWSDVSESCLAQVKYYITNEQGFDTIDGSTDGLGGVLEFGYDSVQGDYFGGSAQLNLVNLAYIETIGRTVYRSENFITFRKFGFSIAPTLHNDYSFNGVLVNEPVIIENCFFSFCDEIIHNNKPNIEGIQNEGNTTVTTNNEKLLLLAQ